MRPFPWRSERHSSVLIATDASLSGCTAVYENTGEVLVRGSWEANDKSPIHVKEVIAARKALEALGER